MNGFCDQKDCTALSDVRPVLFIYPPWPSDCPAKGVIGKEYCSVHGQALTVEFFVTDEGWQEICAGFDRVGKVQPERSRLKLVLEPLVHAERN